MTRSRGVIPQHEPSKGASGRAARQGRRQPHAPLLSVVRPHVLLLLLLQTSTPFETTTVSRWGYHLGWTSTQPERFWGRS